VLVVGQPGIGKTVLLKRLSERIIELHPSKTVQITASTVIASASLDGMTIHKFTGIVDGRFSIQQVVNRQKGEQYKAVKERIIKTDVLFIDEVSMLSTVVFDQIGVLRELRDSKLPFGGMQVLMFGDFHQLKPVPNHSVRDPGTVLVDETYMDRLTALIPHHHLLTRVYRQTESDLITAVHELCRGEVSDSTDKFLTNISKNSNTQQKPDVSLYARNFDAAFANSEKLFTLKGLTHERG